MARTFTFGVRITGDARDGIQTMQLTERELKDLRRELQRTDRGFDKSRRGFRSWTRGMLDIRSAIGPLIGVAGVGMLARFTQQSIASTSELGKAARTAGVTAESLQELRFAFGELAGVADRQTDVALQRFNRRLGLAADGTGAAKDTFGELGVAIETTTGQVRASEPVLDEVLERLASIDNDATRAAKASEIFGEEAGPRLATALKGGIDGMDSARQSARDLGLVMDEDTVAAAERLDDRFNRLTKQLSTSFKTAAVEAGDALAGLADQMDAVFGEGRTQAIAEDTLQRRVASLEGSLENLRGLREDLFAAGPGDRPDAFMAQLLRLNEQIAITQQRLIALRRTERADVSVGQPRVVNRAAALPESLTPSLAPDIPGTLDFRALDEARRQRQARFFAARNFGAGPGPDPLVDLPEVTMSMRELREAARGASEPVRELNNLGADLGMTFSSSLEDSLVSFDDWRTTVTSGLEDVRRIFLRTFVTEPLGRGAGNFISDFILNSGGGGNPLAPGNAVPRGRALGGPVAAGETYLVGERGPELFRPSRAGNIVPNNQIGGAVTVNQAFDFRGADSGTERRLRAEAERIKAETIAEVRNRQQRRGSSRI